jgi:hypothetical protein
MRANSIVSGLLPSPRIDAATLPALSTTTMETLLPSFVHCSRAPSRIISAILIATFFSTCGACASASVADPASSAEAIDMRNSSAANDMVTFPRSRPALAQRHFIRPSHRICLLSSYRETKPPELQNKRHAGRRLSNRPDAVYTVGQ